MNRSILLGLTLLSLVLGSLPSLAQEIASDSLNRTLYVVATSHLDTQWRWTIQSTIQKYIPATFRGNFKLFEAFPDYTFSFEGAFRYQLLKEYYPEEYQRLKPYVANGRWRVAGSWVDAVDVNIPSAESLMRQALYGNGFFRRELGKTSYDVFLPDCFGFGYALPSIAAHCGLKGFSTQKLGWGSAYGVPFDIGLWEGVDGSTLVAELKPGDYVSQVRSDLSRDTTWVKTIDHQGEISGLYAGYKYFGVGDTGGAPDSESVAWVQQATRSEGPIRVLSTGSDELARTLTESQRAKLPRYKGELLMTRHGVGCYTSQAAMKRWNRKNELLADAAERAAVIAAGLGGAAYPREALQDTWTRFLWHQFHDDLTGTSVPEAYQFSWNDEILCQNRFACILEEAVAATSPAFDTRGKGVPLLVFNPLSIAREDVVEAFVKFPEQQPKAVRVWDQEGREVPAQVVENYGDSLKILFLARVPSVGYAVYDVRPSDKPGKAKSVLKVTSTEMENLRYLLRLDDQGNVASIWDKQARRELLSQPLQLELHSDHPDHWPAWEIDYDDVMSPPKAMVSGKADVQIVENGPARVALRIERKAGNSTFVQTIRLAAGEAGNRIEFDNNIDWREQGTLLKAAFRFTAGNDSATYDLGLGTIKRGLNRPELYEVPGQQWADLSSPSGDYGVAVLNDCKYGWDHPDPQTLRLTLIHTPGVGANWSWVGDQASQDLGQHQIRYAITGHMGDWCYGGVPWEAARLNQPLLAFQTTKHKGRMGKELSLLQVTQSAGKEQGQIPSVAVKAVKLAEQSDEVVIRLQELFGRLSDEVRISSSWPLLSAREVNGVEEPVGVIPLIKGEMNVALNPYQPRTMALRLTPPKKGLERLTSAPVALPYNVDGISLDGDRRDGDFDGRGNSLAGELLPSVIHWHDVPYQCGSSDPSKANAVKCAGQTISLPSGEWNKVYLLAAAVSGQPEKGAFSIDGPKEEVWVPDVFQSQGQWNNRLVGGTLVEDPAVIAPAYLNRMPVAWYGSHYHTAAGENSIYQFTYLYEIVLDLPPNTQLLTLPDNQNIRLLAATLVTSNRDPIRPAQPLYDVSNTTVTNLIAERKSFVDQTVVSMSSPIPGAQIHYTLDGSEPDLDSPAYISPLTLTETTTIKARAVLAGMDDAYVTRLTVARHIPVEPVTATDLKPGLLCRYYESDWEELPNFDSLKVVLQATANDISLPDYARPEKFALKFTGFLRVPETGMYTFTTTSDDGSALYIGDRRVVDNDGIHGEWEEGGEIALVAGLHPITVVMFQRLGGLSLGASIEGPGITKQAIAGGMLLHQAGKKK